MGPELNAFGASPRSCLGQGADAQSSELVGTAADKPMVKRTKFTPENVRQIANLVERGTTKEEIANIIGVTTGTLQVACSKLGISLRPPRYDTGTRILRRRRVGVKNAASSEEASPHSRPVAGFTNVQDQPLAENDMKEQELSSGEQETGVESSASVNLEITMHYKGKQRTREIPLPHHMISRLALEAEFRGMATVELIVQLITAAIEKDKVEFVLG